MIRRVLQLQLELRDQITKFSMRLVQTRMCLPFFLNFLGWICPTWLLATTGILDLPNHGDVPGLIAISKRIIATGWLCNRADFSIDQTSISKPTLIPMGAISAVLCYGVIIARICKISKMGTFCSPATCRRPQPAPSRGRLCSGQKGGVAGCGQFLLDAARPV